RDGGVAAGGVEQTLARQRSPRQSVPQDEERGTILDAASRVEPLALQMDGRAAGQSDGNHGRVPDQPPQYRLRERGSVQPSDRPTEGRRHDLAPLALGAPTRL